MKGKILFIISSVIITLLLFPIIFNFLFLWDSGLARGRTTDWFTFYGAIAGGLIGGLFTYVALVYTIEAQNKKNKLEEIFLTKETVLTMKEHVDILRNQVGFINEVLDLTNISDMDKQFEKQLNSKHGGIDVFSGNITVGDYDLLEKSIKDLNSSITNFKIEMKSKYTKLDQIDDYLPKHILDCYLALAHYQEYVERIIRDKEVDSKEFVYSLVATHDKVGLKGIIYELYYLVYDDLYPKYIVKGDYIGELMRSVHHTHIRG